MSPDLVSWKQLTHKPEDSRQNKRCHDKGIDASDGYQGVLPQLSPITAQATPVRVRLERQRD